MMFSMQEPFYGILLSSMQRIAAPHITQTMAVGMSGNVFRLYYNPAFTDSLDIDTTLFCFKHECLHAAFNHFTIFEKTTDKHEHRLRNIACDMEVNSYLDRSKIKNDQFIWPEDYGFGRCLGSRKYLELIKQMERDEQMEKHEQIRSEQQEKQQQMQDSSSNESESNSEGQMQASPQMSADNQENEADTQKNPDATGVRGKMEEFKKEFEQKFNSFDDHDMWPDEMNQAEQEQVKQMVETLLDFAATECEKSRGEIPGELKGLISEIRKKPKPVTDWKRHFRRYLGNEFSDILKKSKKRESKRFPDAAGTRHRRKSRILIGIDTSGSVSMPEYQEFFGQIKTMIATTDFHVIECDARIQHEYDFKGKVQTTLHGGGGTDFSPVIDYYLEHRKEYEGLVYFTDGGAPIPKNTPKETLWVISSCGDQNRKRYQVNGATAVFIPQKK